MQRPILKLPPKDKRRTHSNRRARNQFRAWLISELNKRGAMLPEIPKYVQIRDAVERILLRH
jgi:hypothetical protein